MSLVPRRHVFRAVWHEASDVIALGSGGIYFHAFATFGAPPSSDDWGPAQFQIQANKKFEVFQVGRVIVAGPDWAGFVEVRPQTVRLHGVDYEVQHPKKWGSGPAQSSFTIELDDWYIVATA